MIITNIILTIVWLIVLIMQIFVTVGGADASWSLSITLTVVLFMGTAINALRAYCLKTIKDYYTCLFEHAITDEEFELADIYRDITDKIQKLQ